MKRAWALVLVFVSACGGGGGNTDPADAGPDAADAGAGTDADPSGLDPLGDEDSDGVLNGVDVCPYVVDPAQVDLDGDGVGWMCDSIETKTLSLLTTGDTALPPTGLSGYTMSIGFSSGCAAGACENQVLTVGPGGLDHAISPTDMWVTSIPAMGFVAHENHALWMAGTGTTGNVALPSGAFTPVLTETGFQLTSYGVARYRRGSLVVMPTQSGDTATDVLISPQPDGSVVTVASATVGPRFDSPVMVGNNPPRFVFADPEGTYVREYVEGATASQAIVVGGTALSEGTEAQALVASNQTGDFGPQRQLGFCINKGTKRFIVETITDQIVGYELPLESCAVSVQMTKDRRLKVFRGGLNGAYSIDGVFHPLEGGLWEVYGSTLPAVLSRFSAGTNTVMIIDEGGLHPLTIDGAESKVTRGGGAIHFLAFRGSTPSIVRYRNGVVSEVTLPAIPQGDYWSVFTTADGAAFASTQSTAYVWPSQASAGATVDFDHVDVLLRGNTTLFVASHNDVRSQPALYVYSEVGGAPQYTPLTPEVMQNVPYAMTMQQLVWNNEPFDSEWFSFSKEQEFCRLVRVVVNAGVVSLEGDLQCPSAVHGVTPDGKTILEIDPFGQPKELWTLDGAATFTKVATTYTGAFKILYAVPVGHSFIESPLVLGWGGVVTQVPPATGDDTFVCSASHPERCWRIAGRVDPIASSPLDPHNPDGAHVLFYSSQPGSVVVTSLKMVDNGNLAPPL